MKYLLVLLVFLAMPFSIVAQADSAAFLPCSNAEAPDSDHDGLSDECELALAGTFAPVLVVRLGGCNWRSDDPGTLGGGYFYVVQPVDSLIRIAYAPAYFRDCGWSGIKCWLPWVNCAPHNGDSEFVAVDVELHADTVPIVSGIFLSAHCFGRSSSSCRWYRDQDLTNFDYSGWAPVIWVAEGRQANYPTQAACDAGHHGIDTCDHHNTRYRFPILAEHNLGSRAFPNPSSGCILGRDLNDPRIIPDSVECFWNSTAVFRGWQNTGPGVTGYSRYLIDIARF
jgi:hypothetical protein